jgi:hypothetical protein
MFAKWMLFTARVANNAYAVVVWVPKSIERAAGATTRTINAREYLARIVGGDDSCQIFYVAFHGSTKFCQRR